MYSDPKSTPKIAFDSVRGIMLLSHTLPTQPNIATTHVGDEITLILLESNKLNTELLNRFEVAITDAIFWIAVV